MVSRPLIIIGPKKTASSTFYFALREASHGYQVLPKESNNLINHGIQKNLRVYSKNVIDISPQYFTSYRAFATLQALVKTGEIEPQILIIKRDSEDHASSYINYMASKNLLDNDFTKPEWETLFLQCEFDLFTNLWSEKFNTKILEFGDMRAANDFICQFLSTELNLSLLHKNKGNQEFTGFGRRILYPISHLLRRIVPALWIEKLRNISALRSLAYRNKTSNFDSLISIFSSRK